MMRIANLSNDLLFNLVMQDPEHCRRLLEMILGFSIAKVDVTTQQTIETGFDEKGVRLDVYAADENRTMYDVEMQTTSSSSLGKRFRYYQGKIDSTALHKGDSYRELPKSFIIFICTFDPFGRGLSQYRFKQVCDIDGVEINDGAEWIVLTTVGDGSNVTEEVRDFLQFVDASADENAESEYLRELCEEIDRYLAGKWRQAIMTYEEKLRDMRLDAEEAIQIAVKNAVQEAKATYTQQGKEIGKKEGQLDILERLYGSGAISKETARQYGYFAE